MTGCKSGENKDLLFDADPWKSQPIFHPDSQDCAIQQCARSQGSDEPWVLGSLSSIEGLTQAQITKLPDLKAHVSCARERLEQAYTAFQHDKDRKHRMHQRPDPALGREYRAADEYYDKVRGALTWALRREQAQPTPVHTRGRFGRFQGPRSDV